MEILKQIFSYPFAVRAVIVGLLLSVSAALIGVNLVLKRFSMLGDGLSHVSFGAAAVGLACGVAPLKFSIPIVIAAAFLLLRLKQNSKINGDAATAIVSSSALAVGITVATLTTGMNTDVCNFMFGSILAMSQADVILSIIVSIIVAVLFIIYYRKLFVVTFDENFAKASGLKANRYTNIIAVLTALIIVVGMRMMGVMLISSIIIFPALTSMRIFKSFKKVIISSSIISVISFLIGIYLSYIYNISTGAMIVIVNLVLFILFSIIEKIIHE